MGAWGSELCSRLERPKGWTRIVVGEHAEPCSTQFAMLVRCNPAARGTPYSWRKASIGSSRAALRAGR